MECKYCKDIDYTYEYCKECFENICNQNAVGMTETFRIPGTFGRFRFSETRFTCPICTGYIQKLYRATNNTNLSDVWRVFPDEGDACVYCQINGSVVSNDTLQICGNCVSYGYYDEKRVFVECGNVFCGDEEVDPELVSLVKNNLIAYLQSKRCE
jgi:hypothetical protein